MFRNEPFSDFSSSSERRALQTALDSLNDRISGGGLTARPLVQNKECKTQNIFSRENPADPSIIIGRTEFADITLTDKALQSLSAGQVEWRNVPSERRVQILRTIAGKMRERRHFFSALMILEAGKPWKEADADVAEAIDFCEYYALEMERLSIPQQVSDVPGEDSQYFYQPRGVCVVISPWNFPLAIACGMAVAALVTGNTVALKPAEQTSLVAYEFSKLVYESGVPDNAFAFLPGKGEEIGAYLVADPRVHMICFTGSKAVGLEIIREAGKTSSQQSFVKKVVAELGGKNAIIVDESADIDESIKGVIHSAFGYSGQKCSACSRLIVAKSIYQNFVDRLCEAAKDLIVGPAADPGTTVCPVIDAEAQMRIAKTIQEGQATLKFGFRGEVPPKGCYIGQTIFIDVPPSSPLWRNEIFGPVLCCTASETFEKAVELAVDSEYALTGAVYSRTPDNLEYARRNFRVGNLYINRPSTGALVGRHPFGGFKLSGVGSKAGGPDYLLQFMEPRTVTENTHRKGFMVKGSS